MHNIYWQVLSHVGAFPSPHNIPQVPINSTFTHTTPNSQNSPTAFLSSATCGKKTFGFLRFNISSLDLRNSPSFEGSNSLSDLNVIYFLF